MTILIVLVSAILILLMFGPFAAIAFIGVCALLGTAHWAMENGRHLAPAPVAIGAALIGFGIFGQLAGIVMAGAAIMLLWLIGYLFSKVSI